MHLFLGPVEIEYSLVLPEESSSMRVIVWNLASSSLFEDSTHKYSAFLSR